MACYEAARYAANPEKFKKQRRQWWDANPEKAAQYLKTQRKARAADPGKFRKRASLRKLLKSDNPFHLLLRREARAAGRTLKEYCYEVALEQVIFKEQNK